MELKTTAYEPVLTRPKWLRPANLTPEQEPRLAELLKYNLRSVRAYLLKEDFGGARRRGPPPSGSPSLRHGGGAPGKICRRQVLDE